MVEDLSISHHDMSMTYLKKIYSYRHTIARDLRFSLVVVITLVFAVASTTNYFYSLERDTTALNEKAEEIMDNLASVLVKPLWNIDNNELKKIIAVYRQSEIVYDIKLDDESNQVMVPANKDLQDSPLVLMRVIHYENNPIGRVTVAFSDTRLVEKRREFAVYTAIIFTILTLALMLATTLLVRRFLNTPFDKLKRGLEVISSGNYTHRFDRFKQEDLNEITDRVMHMASEIAKRESALEGNREKLEILNTAILDIFSCSETNGLVRTTLELSNKVCGADFGWFIGDRTHWTGTEEEKQSRPIARICVRGQCFEATDDEVAPHVLQDPSDRIFTFPLRSRHRQVGQITIAYDEVPDQSIQSLLKSLMSLATLALIRQSFIRETAFITAELQVAETVQRSMLPDDARTLSSVIVSHHYEPVLRVGGDWFSIIESRDKQDIFAILGDVTGHGLAQGLVTTAVAGALQVLESLIHDYGTQSMLKPSQIVNQLNRVIARIAGKSNLRMTCVVAKLELNSNRLLVCNAGHTFPIVMRKNGSNYKAETLTRKQQFMLGEESTRGINFSYSDAEYALLDDDVLFLYTDGLTDAVDREGRSFARKFYRFFARTQEIISPDQVKGDLIRLLRSHTNDVPLKDDICLLTISRRPAAKVDAA